MKKKVIIYKTPTLSYKLTLYMCLVGVTYIYGLWLGLARVAAPPAICTVQFMSVLRSFLL